MSVGVMKDVFVYYESINRELKTRPIYECKDRDEVNRRDGCECDG
jgi:hypothetical protein